MTNHRHSRHLIPGSLLTLALSACGGGGGGDGPFTPPPPPPPSGRNDSIATATTLTNGNFAASISPSGDPATLFSPDEDFYRIVTTGMATVTVDIDAQVNGSAIDSVIEIVGANGLPLNTCGAPNFNSACINDDDVNLDSILQVRVAAASTFFVHVVDFRGDARPDLLYTIKISGVT
jgi:hypothetical protein